MKGIVLAGGSGTRLLPLTSAVSKQLLPVYDKPLIYYPLSVLMLGGIREILLISSPDQLPLFHTLFGDGSRLGLSISYAEQTRPDGIAQALTIGADHIGTSSVTLILGDNIFHGPGFSHLLQSRLRQVAGALLFGYAVSDPQRYAVGETIEDGSLVSIEEKPAEPRSNLALTGLYAYNNDVVDIAKNLRPSARGELEITDVNRAYLEQGRAQLVRLGRGFSWLDAGTHDSLLQAANYVQVLEQRQGMRIACLEEIAYRMGFITAEECQELALRMGQTSYGHYLLDIVEREATRSD
ncbi:glucose-1-phosphate thymidylyltransferase [Streptomyces nodosus]|uniref:Glucose-1-phosphate thymidylyltransferase n=1 Tax=Streptomyces nodosus TaxID=40318 RepID=A0A5P2W067_9ACTN|nr:glucose-1-phosphate thymidylyltransferase RfbA [Streptomyces nodosus]MBB4796245.1 glucose-1-phosphate thymidylyltransferase [Streptomyces nodosus]QEV37213.1 glucose-1-phosphate thymidylyltransferase [Streptomyces nodosus]